MSKRNDRARYPLPIDVSPRTSICFQVPVPNDIFHIAAFMGQLNALASAYSWSDDPAHTALDVAKVWREIFDNLQRCAQPPVTIKLGAEGGDEQLIRQNPDNPCLLETSINGTDWCPFADLSLCIAGPSQPGAGAPQPQPGGGVECYHAELSANEQWLLPTAVNAGDVLVISGVSGAWSDGTNWYCPNGQAFILGLCTGLFPVLSSTDPLPTQPHGSLVTKIAAAWSEVGLGASLTVPSGVAEGQVIFQMNDDSRSDNSGTLVFDVCVTNNQLGAWSVVFDFTLASHSAEFNHGSENGNDPKGWVSGVGYQSGLSGWIVSLTTNATAPSGPCVIEKIEVTAGTLFHNGTSGGVSASSDIGSPNGLSNTINLRTNNGGVSSFIWPTPLDVWSASGHATALGMSASSFDHVGSTNDNNTWISKVVISGTGATPTFAHP